MIKLAVIKSARVLMSTDGAKRLFIDTGRECIQVCARADLEKVYDLLYSVPVSAEWTLGGVLSVAGRDPIAAGSKRFETEQLRAVGTSAVEYRWWYFYDGEDAAGHPCDTSEWLQGASIAEECRPAAGRNARIQYIRCEVFKADRTVLTDITEVSSELLLYQSSIAVQASVQASQQA